MEKVLIDDIAELKTASEIRLNPKGTIAVYAVVIPDKQKNRYRTDLWKYENGTAVQLTCTGNNGSFQWEDDETLLIETVRRDEDKAKDLEEKTSFYRLNVHGGEAMPAFTIKANVTGMIKAEDGKRIVRILKDRNRPDESVPEDVRREEKDYHIFDEVPFWGNGRGYISGKRNVLYLFDEKTGALKQLSDETMSAGSFKYRDGYVYYLASVWNDVISEYRDIYRTNLKTGKTKKLTDGSLSIMAFDFAGGRIFYAATDMKQWGSGEERDIYAMNPDGSKKTLLYENETIAIMDGILIDTQRPGQSFKADKNMLYFAGLTTHRADIYAMDETGNVTKAVDFKGGAVSSFDVSNGKIVFIGSAKNALPAVYEKNRTVKCIDDPNKEYLKEHYIAQAESCSFKNSDGYQIEGWVLKPYNYSPKKKYPGLLEIHGGPRCAYGTAFYHEMQAYASSGYFVFFCNPRGSEGYGEEFADIRGRYGDIDYKDLMEFTDHVLKQYPQIDQNRLGALGGSYGGFMCNWIEGHTDKFKAICSQRSVSNWLSDFGTSEIGVVFDTNEMASDPWKDPAKVWDMSPLKYADHAKTPILFIHSLEDYNCFIDQGVQMFTAMKYFHVPSRMVVFEGESHSLSRSGKPKHRIRRLKEMLDWFDQYVK